MDCIFCKIVEGTVPSTKVYEDDNFIVIKDINPQAPVHLLVIPKRHYPTLMDCDERDILGGLIDVAKRVSTEKRFHERGFRLVINTNEEGGQTVFHLHMHILAGRALSGKMG